MKYKKEKVLLYKNFHLERSKKAHKESSQLYEDIKLEGKYIWLL